MKFNLIQGIGRHEVSKMKPKALKKLREQLLFNINIAEQHEQIGIIDHQNYLLEIVEDVLDF